MSKYKSLLIALSIGIILLINPACSDETKKLLGEWVVEKAEIGGEINKRWTSVMAGNKVEFFSDKTTLWWDGLSGNWVILDDGRIKIQCQTGVYFASFSGDKLILKEENNDLTLKRFNVKNDIIGTWQTISGKITTEITFNKDMRCVIRVIVPGGEDSGTQHYKFIDKNRIETEGAVIYTIKKLSSDELILYRAGWKKDIIYKRIR